MKFVNIICLLLINYSVCVALPSTDSLTVELNQAIKDAQIYDNSKLKEITKLKNELNEAPPNNLDKQYQVNLELYNEYKYYNYDSALVYASELQRLAYYKSNSVLITDAKLKVVFVMLSSGMFKETFDSLNVISVDKTNDSLKAEYYSLRALAYYNLSDFNSDINSPVYNARANLYLDSALALYPINSFENLYYSALKFLKKGNTDSALLNLNKLMARGDLSYHQIALATSTTGGIYLSRGHEDEAKPYLIRASIADIKSSTKETLALLTLAGIIYKEGDLDEAVLYIEKANEDAKFYNTRFRKVQIGAILPLIEEKMIYTIKSQKEKLQLFLVALSILVILLGGFSIIIRNQVKKLKTARKRLFEVNNKLQQINQELLETNEIKEKYNEQLQEINHKLLESNKIKEEYIGYYFNMDTEFLVRIEKLKNSLDKKLVDRKWEEMKFVLNSIDLKKEKQELLKNFDKVFVRLFPNFVNQFNTLFKEEDKIILKGDELLNNDLRIFALGRLGITENEKIAEILDYSINTIYAKKTKIRNKTTIPNDELDKKIMEITTLNFY
jgi:hypothetical protein